MTSTKGKVPTGFADEIALSEHTFRTQRLGLMKNKDTSGSKKRKREQVGDPSIVFGEGAYKGPWRKFKEATPESEEEVSEYEEVEVDEDGNEIEAEPQLAKPSKLGTDYETAVDRETTIFHGSAERDYQGRTYMHVPQDLGIKLNTDEVQPCFIPKKNIHTWREHKDRIMALRFFPQSGHLLLSASADSTIKLYDVYHERELLRSYNGHNKLVGDVSFNNDGTRFLSASYDRQMKLWDTETGACISKYSTGKTPHVIRFNPNPDLNHEFLAGMSDKKIIQYDTRSGELVQEYDHHLGPVNTITFCDENRRFITTSDDKSLRAWEYGIPVPIKFIAEPDMFSMNRSAMHPSQKYVAFTGQDNTISVYNAADKFRQNRKKAFLGANYSGYAVDVAISPDGRYVSSGDTGGYVCFWDWKTCKMYEKWKASDSALLSVQWHPRETSKVVTGDLNGVIKYWD